MAMRVAHPNPCRETGDYSKLRIQLCSALPEKPPANCTKLFVRVIQVPKRLVKTPSKLASLIRSPQNADHADCRPCRLCRLSTFFRTLDSLFTRLVTNACYLSTSGANSTSDCWFTHLIDFLWEIPFTAPKYTRTMH